MFFSICIPATNRSRTIYETLKSSVNQTFKDYEIIVTLDSKDQKTIGEIEKFFSSDDYLKNPVSYIFKKIEHVENEFSEWNDPILLASGKYIAMLEGDDQFYPERLQVAYDFLSKNSQYGIFVSGNENQNQKRKYIGFFKPHQYIKFILNYIEIPPPSEAIFIHKNRDGEKFLYNIHDFVFAPEGDLYIRVAQAGFPVCHDPRILIFRERSFNDPLKGNRWKYHADKFTLFNKYKRDYNIFFQLITRFKLEVSITIGFFNEAAHLSSIFPNTFIYKFLKRIKKIILKR